MINSTRTQRVPGIMHWIERLQSIEVGGKKDVKNLKIPSAKLVDLLRMLLMLINNGLSLPKALAAVCEDRTARKWLPIFTHMQSVVRQGGSISAAMSRFPRTFTAMQIEQVRLGERTGSLQRALEQIASEIEARVAMRRQMIKKLSYPVMILCAGLGLVIFMVVVVVPQFESVFAESGVKLPMVTRIVTASSKFLFAYGLLIVIAIMGAIGALLHIRTRPQGRMWLHKTMLRIPIIGVWLRDAAALQFSQGVLSMIESGYTPVEAIESAVPSVKNRAVRTAVIEVCRGVQRGERLSIQMGKYPNLFPPTLCQVVSVGEKSGDFARAMQGACKHLRSQLERRTDRVVGLLEPILTLSLAVIIGTVVMSIYLPMFHMFEVLE